VECTERCGPSSVRTKGLSEEPVSKNLTNSCTSSILGIAFSYTTKEGECVSSSEIITLVCGILKSNNVAILGKAIKLMKIIKTNMLQKFFSVFSFLQEANIKTHDSKNKPSDRIYLNINNN